MHASHRLAVRARAIPQLAMPRLELPQLLLPKRLTHDALIESLPVFVQAPMHGQPSPFARVNQDATWALQGTLDPRCVSYFAPANTAEPQAMVLLFHGFGAAPFQFHDWVMPLNAQGVAVYAVRAPGHGELRKGQRHPDALPRAAEKHLYVEHVQQAAREAEDHARARGIPLYVGGFSLGGAMALDVASSPRQVPVDRLLLVAPLIQPGHAVTQSLFAAARTRGHEAWMQYLIDHVPAVGGPLHGANGPGHFPFPLHRAFAPVHYASDVTARIRALPRATLPPVHLIGSKYDVTTDWRAPLELLAAHGGEHTVCMFEAEERVAHTMLGSYENHNRAIAQRINERAIQVLRP